MYFRVVDGPLGNQPITSGQAPDSTRRQTSGLIVNAVSHYWGGAEFIYARAGGSIRQFGLTVCTPELSSGAIRHNMTEVPNTANLGRPVYVAMTGMTSGDWGWFMQSGMVPVNCSANVAADTTFGIAAAGQGGANSAGKQILGARVILASSTTVAKANSFGLSGSYQIRVTDSDGLFIGAYLSGTGVGTNAKISSISADGKTLTVDVANTAQITGTVTATYNNATIYYNVAHLNRPIAQGAIT